MSKRNMMLLFLCAGLILALIMGVYVYQMNRPPDLQDAADLLQTYVGRIVNHDLRGARDLMTPETAGLLRDPGTALGMAVYKNLSLASVEHALPAEGRNLTVDVVLNTLDTFAIMTKAGQLFAEQVTENGPAEDPDAAIAEIYDEILMRDDLPMIPAFLIVHLTYDDGSLRIVGDTTLQNALEGNSSANLTGISGIFGSE